MNSPVKESLQLIASLPSDTKKRSGRPKSTKSVSASKKTTPTSVAPSIEVSEPPLENSQVTESQNIVFKPNAGPQSFFLAAGQREVLYGGAAGGRGVGLSLATSCW